MHGHQIAALLQSPAHGVGTAPPAAEIAEAFFAQPGTLIDAIGLVGDLRGRGHAGIEPRGVDERLDGRARLAQRLGGAVEAAETRIEAALHGHDAAGLRVLEQQCT